MQINSEKLRENTEKFREMQRNSEKFWEIQRNTNKCIYAELSSWPSWPLWPSWHTGMSYLISLNPLHLNKTENPPKDALGKTDKRLD